MGWGKGKEVRGQGVLIGADGSRNACILRCVVAHFRSQLGVWRSLNQWRHAACWRLFARWRIKERAANWIISILAMSTQSIASSSSVCLIRLATCQQICQRQPSVPSCRCTIHSTDLHRASHHTNSVLVRLVYSATSPVACHTSRKTVASRQLHGYGQTCIALI